ncbi:MAG TPA: long-chain fatty acid--CoA ligase [Gammaproteobacteria bacterium]|nr:long-chain fatty acid--CoA ligase [Gammaproteobacteria bacterium]
MARHWSLVTSIKTAVGASGLLNEDTPSSEGAAADTFPKLLLRNAEQLASHPAIREKEFGIWHTRTWSEVKSEVEQLAGGLLALGFERGDKLLIIGDNRPQLYWSITAAQCLGGIPVPTYQDAVADEIQYVLEHAEARFVIAEDQEQIDKVLEIQEHCPLVQHLIYDDPRGLEKYSTGSDRIHAFTVVQEKGRQYLDKHPGFFINSCQQGKGVDAAVFLYTSGTTGRPKGVVLSYDNFVKTARSGIELEHLTADEEVLAYLPMAWVGDHLFSYAQSYCAGFCVSCPESAQTVQQDLREIGPTYYFAPPRIFENMLTTVMIRMEDAGIIKRQMFHYFLAVARRVGSDILDGKPVSFLNRVRYWLGEWTIYAPLKNTLGLSRVRLAYTAGEAIGPDIFSFYRSLGINIKQLYGQTEAAVFVTIQPDGEVFPDTVGKPAPGVEIEIQDNGEVLYRSPGVFLEYYKNAQATRETKDEEGWVHTGDAGYFDQVGHLRIIDRAKDVGKLTNGELFAPKFLENKLKFFPQIKEAVCFGDNRSFVTAFVNIDLDAVGNWAERENIPYASYQELAGHEKVYSMVNDCILQVNKDLTADPKLASSTIHRFLILHKELDADDGEMTRTRKVRRRVIAEKYAVLIDALFEGQGVCHVDTEVTFEDGRKGVISADLEIREISSAA